MSLLQSDRLGAQVPVIQHLPPDVVSLAAAEDAIELADAYGVCDGNPLSESQKITIRAAGGERADGSWAATRVGDFGPRQGTGKNDKIAAWELAHLLLFGTDLIIHTAHEFPTANESFLRLVAVFDAWDDLRKKVARIRYANGEQGIELLTGQRLKYRARTGGSGRGFAKAGLIIYDEAQHLHREHVAASGPAKLANPNSQTWVAGSGGLSTSDKAWEMRLAAILGTGGRLAFTEMTGERITVDANGNVLTVPPDPTDREVWYRCIPGLGRWVTEESVEALYDELGPELFTREILCCWDPLPNTDGSVWVIPEDKYRAGNDPASKIEGTPSLAIAVAPDRSWSALAAAGTSNLGGVHAGILRYHTGTDWLPEEIKRWGTNVVLAKDSAAASLVPDLKAAGITTDEYTSTQQGAAFGQVFDAAIAGDFHHHNPGELETSVKQAELRLTEGGVSVLSPKRSTVDISPLVAVTLAVSKHLQPPEASRKTRTFVIGGAS